MLPALYSEFEGPAMPGIIQELTKVKYLNEIVLALDEASEDQFKRVRELMAPIPTEVRIIHNKGKRITEVYETLARNGLDAGQRGKGRSAWISYGYVLARGRSDVIALHDCDIVTYNRELLARLCYPVACPNLDYVFCKGYYSRITNKMNGRVTRLLVTPLVRSIQQLIGQHDFLMFLDSFRYPLAGEFCMTTDSGAREPDTVGLGAGGRLAGRGAPQLFAAPRLPGGHRRDL